MIVALDFPRLEPAVALSRKLRREPALGGIQLKIGSQLFTAEGPRAVERLARFGAGIFLDLKFHDIPNTVAGAVAAAARLSGVRLINVHALGGLEMMRAARRALGQSKRRPKLIAVTVLTSMDTAALRRTGIEGTPEKRAVRLAMLAREAGLDGVVASPHEIRAIRRGCGTRFLIVTPGIRPATAAHGDQARIATPAEAIRAGADYLVVGRPITVDRDPAAAAGRIIEEMCCGEAD